MAKQPPVNQPPPIDITREVNDEIARERMQNFVQRYSKIIISITVLILLAMAAYIIWQNRQDARVQDDSIVFNDIHRGVVAFESVDDIEGKIATLQESDNSYKMLSLFLQGKHHAGLGDLDKAIAAYNKVADSVDVEPQYKYMATILAAQHMIQKGNDTEQIVNKLQPLEDTHFKYSARELIATSYLNQGNTEQARVYFEKLATSFKAPRAMVKRAEKILKTIGASDE